MALVSWVRLRAPEMRAFRACRCVCKSLLVVDHLLPLSKLTEVAALILLQYFQMQAADMLGSQ